MCVQQFDSALANLVYDFQMYLTSYISYHQLFKTDIRIFKDLFRMLISPEMEAFNTHILIKTTFPTIFNFALIIDSDLATNLTKFSNLLLSLATTASNALDIPL